jgi:hypothetical protein
MHVYKLHVTSKPPRPEIYQKVENLNTCVQVESVVHILAVEGSTMAEGKERRRDEEEGACEEEAWADLSDDSLGDLREGALGDEP